MCGEKYGKSKAEKLTRMREDPCTGDVHGSFRVRLKGRAKLRGPEIKGVGGVL